MDAESQGMFADAERARVPSPMLVAATVCVGPFCPAAMYTGPMAAAPRRSSGAAERNPQDRERRTATSFIGNVSSIPRAMVEPAGSVPSLEVRRMGGFISPQGLWRLETLPGLSCVN